MTAYRRPLLDSIREKAGFVPLATRVKHCATLTLGNKTLSGELVMRMLWV